MCAWLVDGLLELGFRITLIGAGKSHTRARFFATFDPAPSDRPGRNLPDVVHALESHRIIMESAPDLVHDHSLAGPLLAPTRRIPTVVTAHRSVVGDDARYYRGLTNVALVASSQAQRVAAADLPWVGMVHNGVPVDNYPYSDSHDGYALFLSRITPDKGPDIAIQAARAAGLPLVLAGGGIFQQDHEFFDAVVRPLLGPDVEVLGPVDRLRKVQLLSRAACLLSPVRWSEPFGLIMVEAMACGTPVVALRSGSVPELVAHGSTGFVCDSPDQLPLALRSVGSLSRQACRERAKQRFDVAAMAASYAEVYGTVLGHSAGV